MNLMPKFTSRIGKYWNLSLWSLTTTIIILTHLSQFCLYTGIKVVLIEIWNLFYYISLHNRIFDSDLIFRFLLETVDVSFKWIHLCVLHWPPHPTSYVRWITRCSMKLKKLEKNIFYNLYIVSTLLVSRLEIWSMDSLVVQISLIKKLSSIK